MLSKKYLIISIISLILVIILNGIIIANKVSYSSNTVQIAFSGSNNAEFPPCQCKYDPYGGLAKLATLINESRVKNPDIIWINLGDFLSPDNELKKHKLVMKVMNDMKYDMIVPGDQDFVHGSEFLIENNLNDNYICSNMNTKNNDYMNIKIIKRGDLNIAFFALQNKSHFSMTEKSLISDLVFSDTEKKIELILKKFKSAKIDYIVCLSHLGYEMDQKLMKKYNDIDLLLSGHSVRKEVDPIKFDKRLLIQNDYDAKYAGMITLIFAKGKLKHYYFKSVALDENYPEDPNIMHDFISLNRGDYPDYLK